MNNEPKRNYDREMEAEIAALEGRRPTLLLHSCCGGRGYGLAGMPVRS